jgi:hypothetical protein
MLWKITDDKPYKNGIIDAATYYKNKYGEKPTHCVVNETVEAPKSVVGIKVQRSHNILPKFVFIGTIEKSK